MIRSASSCASSSSLSLAALAAPRPRRKSTAPALSSADGAGRPGSADRPVKIRSWVGGACGVVVVAGEEVVAAIYCVSGPG